MHIVIVGAGELGTHLASELTAEEKNVTIIDRSASALERFSKIADVATILGSGSNWKILDSLLEQKPDYLISMTGSDETNLVACNLAKSLGFPKTIARISSKEFLEASKIDFGSLFYVDYFIGPETIVAYDLFKNILNPFFISTQLFSHGAIQMQTFIVGKKWDKSQVPLKKIDLAEKLLVGLIKRKTKENGEHIIFPGGNDRIMIGDEITIVGETASMLHLPKYFGVAEKKIQAIVIVGANEIGVKLCDILYEHKIDIYFIEKNLKLCQWLSTRVPFATIINQNEQNLDFLVTERVHEKDAFIACHRNTQDNLLAVTLAQEAGCKNVISLVPDISYSHLFRRLKITYALSEKISVANQALSILHGEGVASLTSLYDSQVKIVEFKMSSQSKIVGIPLSDLRNLLPKDSLIALIENRGQIIIGKGNRILSPGDTVIAFTTPKAIKHLTELF